ncbi:MarR family winged helix-turn-helix transcriptional regulator [Devosia sp.]|uniref:MarR family winged helix-turn-helix transcriptional regulator n=1 Tax=Devosia sp. TaxID=1871048 RepID=UPI003A917452
MTDRQMTDPRDALHLEHQLCFAVYSAAHAFTRFYRPLLTQLGVTYPQYLVLLVLWEADGLSVTAIGERLLLDSGTLTPLLKRLENMQLLTRRRAADDERRMVVSLTEKGRALQQVAADFPANVHAASHCKADDIAAMRSALFDLRDKLDAATARAAASPQLGKTP